MSIPSYIDPHGQERFLGNIIPDGGLKLGSNDFKVYGDSNNTPLIKETDYEDRPIPSYAPKVIKNQKRTNMCNAFSCCYAIEGMRHQMGLTPLEVSAGYIYGAINDGVDEGSRLEDAMMRLLKTGYVSTDVIPMFNWNPQQWPNNAAELAKERVVTELWLCPRSKHIMSALHCGFSVIVGMLWSEGDVPDEDGWLPEEPEGEIVGGHALCCFSPAKKGKKIGFKTPNTWGKEWGINGWCKIPARRFDSGPFTGAWAIRQLSIGQGDLRDVPLPVN